MATWLMNPVRMAKVRLFLLLLLVITLTFPANSYADGPDTNIISHFECLIDINQGLMLPDSPSKPYLAWLLVQPGYFSQSGIRFNGSAGLVFTNPGSAFVIGGRVARKVLEGKLPVDLYLGVEGHIDLGFGDRQFQYFGAQATADLLGGLGGLTVRWGYEFDREVHALGMSLNIAIIN